MKKKLKSSRQKNLREIFFKNVFVARVDLFLNLTLNDRKPSV